jgi:hypothetical protein
LQPPVKVRAGDAEFRGFAGIARNHRKPQVAVTVKALFEVRYGWGDGLIVELTPV